MAQMVHGLIPSRWKRIFLYSKTSTLDFVPPSLLFSWFQVYSGLVVKLTTDLHLVTRLRMSGAIPLWFKFTLPLLILITCIQNSWELSTHSANNILRHTLHYFQIIKGNPHEQLIFVSFQCASNTARTSPRRKVCKSVWKVHQAETCHKILRPDGYRNWIPNRREIEEEQTSLKMSK